LTDPATQENRKSLSDYHPKCASRGYSPNLNLIERLWRFVKKECLACRPLPDYDTFTQAIDDCLNG
jgi:hypothetical protein